MAASSIKDAHTHHIQSLHTDIRSYVIYFHFLSVAFYNEMNMVRVCKVEQ